ncbi:hypothetical protein EDD86DRAFT_189191 [Gorgonomyces haynaldii]|nr:hypothetical protein EDD86DRAFT_189191 [Gorgonomyces haynaldii]
MSSGIGLDSQVVSLYEEMKLSKKWAYLVFKISEDLTTIQLDQSLSIAESKRLGSEAVYEKFVQAMPQNEGRYGIYDLEYQLPMEGIRNKLIFVMWNPADGKVRSRMMYASSKAAIRKRLDGIHQEVQCTDFAELSFEAVFSQVAPKEAEPMVAKALEE